MTALFDDHDTSDNDTELQVDFPVLPPQQSLKTFLKVPDHFETIKEDRKKVIHAAIEHLQKQAAQLSCKLPPTTVVPFRLS
jgi:hypothetical protein